MPARPRLLSISSGVAMAAWRPRTLCGCPGGGGATVAVAWRHGSVGGGVAAMVAAIEWRCWRGDGGGDATNFSEGD